MMTRAIGYIRVSTDKQANEGVSLDAQRIKIQTYAALYDIELVEIVVDAGESAKDLERPALQAALARLGKDVDALLVAKLDRLTRSVKDLCLLVDTYFRTGKLSLLSVAEQIDTRSAAGRMVLNILTVIGQWERETIGERTSAAMQHMKSQGEYTGGGVPFGYEKHDGKLVELADEQRIIEMARTMRHDQGMSLRSIAFHLPPQRNGKPFTATQIQRMCK